MTFLRAAGSDKRWGALGPLMLAPVYVLVCWLPVPLLAGDAPETFGSRGWPFVSPLAAVVWGVGAVGLVWLLVMRDGDRGPRLIRWLLLPRWACLLGALVAVALAVLVYLEWVHAYAPSTDRATALQIGWDLLRSGENPYRGETQLGNPIAPMVGGILLAGAFITVLGSLYWYGLATLVVLTTVVGLVAGPRAAFAVSGLLVFSPMIRMELYSQSDSWINAVWLALTAAFAWWLVRRPRLSGFVITALVLVSVLFGLALAYRYIYSPIALPLVALMWREVGWTRTAWFAVPAAVVSVALALGPWLIAPEIYAPFIKSDHADSDVVPHFKIVLAVTMLVIYVVGAVVVRSLAGVYLVSAAATLTMVLLLVWATGGWQTYEAVAYNGSVLVFLILGVMWPPQGWDCCRGG